LAKRQTKQAELFLLHYIEQRREGKVSGPTIKMANDSIKLLLDEPCILAGGVGCYGARER